MDSAFRVFVSLITEYLRSLAAASWDRSARLAVEGKVALPGDVPDIRLLSKDYSPIVETLKLVRTVFVCFFDVVEFTCLDQWASQMALVS